MSARWLGVVTLATITLLAGPSAPAQAQDTGTIAGRFTSVDGSGFPFLSVKAVELAGGGTGSTFTNEFGNYQITGLRPGAYRVSFSLPGGLTQYAHGKTDPGDATPINVTAGTVSTVDEQVLPTGVIEGTYRDPNLPGGVEAEVVLLPLDGGATHSTRTLPNGHFFVGVFPGRYRVAFQLRSSDPSAGMFVQYAGGTDVPDEATVFEVLANQRVTVNETKLPTGSLHGRFTDAAGNGIPNVEVSISRPDLGRGPSAYTDGNGGYSFPQVRSLVGWRVQFIGTDPAFSQFAFGKVRESEADFISVSNGGFANVSDSLLPTGSVKVTAKDATTGAVIEMFQAGIEGTHFAQTGTGELVLQSVPNGTHPVLVTAYGYEDRTGTVTVTAGSQAQVTVNLVQKSAIHTKVVDAVTGAPVAGVCLIAAEPQWFRLPDGCNDSGQISSATGKVLVETGGAGQYQLFALTSGAPGYGSQWVRANGGTGNQLLAQLVQVPAGKAAQAPVIRLDRAGTVTGTTEAHAAVSPGDWSQFTGAGPGVVSADEQGRYTIDFLGPYEWPLRFYSGAGNGIQWSGQVGNRYLAWTVTVRTGQTTNYNFAFKAPVRVNVAVTDLAEACIVYAFNSVTGDGVGAQAAEDCATPVDIPIVGRQAVKFLVYYGSQQQRWYGGDSFLTATPVPLPNSGTKQVVLS